MSPRTSTGICDVAEDDQSVRVQHGWNEIEHAGAQGGI